MTMEFCQKDLTNRLEFSIFMHFQITTCQPMPRFLLVLYYVGGEWGFSCIMVSNFKDWCFDHHPSKYSFVVLFQNHEIIGQNGELLVLQTISFWEWLRRSVVKLNVSLLFKIFNAYLLKSWIASSFLNDHYHQLSCILELTSLFSKQN